MTVRVRAPGALAEQRGRGKKERPLPKRLTGQGKRPRNRLQVLGASLTVGRPALPRWKCRSESDAPNQRTSGAVLLEAARPRITNPGIEPRSE
jgi:hypothetical protein